MQMDYLNLYIEMFMDGLWTHAVLGLLSPASFRIDMYLFVHPLEHSLHRHKLL